MKTFNNLYSNIISFENLFYAAKKAAKGKREKFCVMDFFLKLEDNLLHLQDELNHQTYSPGIYTTFEIYDPKPRIISAAPFRDRVVHHALMNIISPLLENSFIFDSYANRIGKGVHKAIQRYHGFVRNYPYALKLDIKSYFQNIDHDILKSLLCSRIKCKNTLKLINIIIDSSHAPDSNPVYFPGDELFTPIDRLKGLPLGNLTSQLFANFYLNPLDHFVKEKLHCNAYLRYVDDFALFAHTKSQLWDWKNEIEHFLEFFRLKLQPKRCHLYPTSIGNRFLGQIVFLTHRRLVSESVRKFKKRKRNWDKFPPKNLKQRVDGWIGHAKQANTYSLLKSLKL